MLWSIETVFPLPAQFPQQISTIHGSTSELSKHLRFPMCKSVLQSSPLMRSTMPGKFVSTTGNRESRVISRSTGDPRTPETQEPIWFDPESYKKRSAGERFSSWIEAFKKVTPQYEHSSMGLVHLACSVMIRRIWGDHFQKVRSSHLYPPCSAQATA